MSTMEDLHPSELAMSKAQRRPRSEPRKLIEALRAGDRTVANQVVEQTYAQVYASLFRMCGDPDLAADLTQDTYARAWRSLAAFEGRCRFSTWLYRIAYARLSGSILSARRQRNVCRIQGEAPLASCFRSSMPVACAEPCSIFRRIFAMRLQRAIGGKFRCARSLAPKV